MIHSVEAVVRRLRRLFPSLPYLYIIAVCVALHERSRGARQEYRRGYYAGYIEAERELLTGLRKDT